MTVSIGEPPERRHSRRSKPVRGKHAPRFPSQSQLSAPAAPAPPPSGPGHRHQPHQQQEEQLGPRLYAQARRSDVSWQARRLPLSSPASSLGPPSGPAASRQRAPNPPTSQQEQAQQQKPVNVAQQQQSSDKAAVMKFGKRLASEAARRWSDYYFDYKAIKKAIKDDINNQDALGANFHMALLSELSKVSRFYSDKATQLEATLHRLQLCALQPGISQELGQLRAEVQELIKFVALNYLAVVKGIKKRNRLLKEQFGPEHSTSLRALDMLGHEVFFTSPRLAALSTQAEILSVQIQATQASQGALLSQNNQGVQGSQALSARQPQQQQLQGAQQGQQAGACGAAGCACSQGAGGDGSAVCRQRMLEEYQCPICLETLHNPVVLTCAHRFCWGCLVAHCTAARHERLPIFSASSKQNSGRSSPEALSRCSSLSPTEDMALSMGSGTSPAVAAQYYSCPASLRLLEEIALREETEPGTAFYNCPVCRKPQVLEVESLYIDQHLCSFIEDLRASVGALHAATTQAPAISSSSNSVPSALALAPPLPPPEAPPGRNTPWGILPPQAPHHRGRLTVLLDVDGTLISSFTPRRAPRLPASVKTHVVGVGSKLNPQGVFVVERPGLRAFLEQLCLFAEVVIFTAGLEDYARPIIDALDPEGKFFAHRIYREGCVKTEYYQCVKDMARVNRALGRTVLVDDTPLAFLHQPDNGIPVLGFRGDPDDRLLMEAVLPLLQSLDQQEDVRETLQRRFDMAAWFKRHGFPVDKVIAASLQAAEEERRVAEALGLPWGHAPSPQQLEEASSAASCVASGGAAPAPHTPPLQDVPLKRGSEVGQAASSPAPPPNAPSGVALAPGSSAPAAPTAAFSEWLLLAGFDRTLVDFSPVERLVEVLAPELLPSLVGQGDALPLVNSLLEEIQRRGVSRDQLLATLQEMGGELCSSPAFEALRVAKQQLGARVALLSDSNSVIMSHLLAGAKAAPLVDEVLTNPAAFERVAAAAGAAPGMGVGLGLGAGTGAAGPMGMSPGSPNASSGGNSAGGNSVGQKLVAKPRTGASAAEQGVQQGQGHRCCGGCPASLCRGAEVRALKQRGAARRIAYCGDSASDVCAAFALGPEDTLLARRGGALAQALAEGSPAGAAGAVGAAVTAVQAKVVLWGSAEELSEAVRQVMAGAGSR